MVGGVVAQLVGGVVSQLVGGVVVQLVSGTVHWVTQSRPGLEFRLKPPTVGTLRGKSIFTKNL